VDVWRSWREELRSWQDGAGAKETLKGALLLSNRVYQGSMSGVVVLWVFTEEEEGVLGDGNQEVSVWSREFGWTGAGAPRGGLGWECREAKVDIFGH
jgi:hypothetical protein